MAATSGFRRVQKLQQDIKSADGFVSRTACRLFMDLVRFCIAQGTGETSWPRSLNSVHARALPPAAMPQNGREWMECRGLMLIIDLHWELRLFDEFRGRLREFMVDALRFVADHCFDQEWPANREGPSWLAPCRRRLGGAALRVLSHQVQNADDFVSRSASDALVDRKVRRHWRFVYTEPESDSDE